MGERNAAQSGEHRKSESQGPHTPQGAPKAPVARNDANKVADKDSDASAAMPNSLILRSSQILQFHGPQDRTCLCVFASRHRDHQIEEVVNG